MNLIDPYRIVIVISSSLILISLLTYYRMYKNSRVLTEQRSLSEVLIDLISHIPDASKGPWTHILAGVSLILGLGLGIAALIADNYSKDEDFVSAVVSASSLVIGAMFSTVTMWTLWQARRLEFQAGYKIQDFHHLIMNLNDELDKLLYSLETRYHYRAQSFHRVYLVTTQPFLGSLTYDDEVSRQFATKLKSCADACSRSLSKHLNGKAERYFEFHIICGNETRISNFHSAFYESKISDNEIQNRNKSVETDLAFMQQKVDNVLSDSSTAQGLRSQIGPLHRVPVIPKVQYMIVGNKLYEFTLESGNSHSEIFNTQVVSDSRYCDAYIEHFNIFLEASNKQQ